MKRKFSLVGVFLKKKRLQKGLSQVELAVALQCTAQFICNWERGASKPPPKLWKNLIKTLQIRPEEFLDVLLEEECQNFFALLKK